MPEINEESFGVWVWFFFFVLLIAKEQSFYEVGLQRSELFYLFWR